MLLSCYVVVVLLFCYVVVMLCCCCLVVLLCCCHAVLLLSCCFAMLLSCCVAVFCRPATTFEMHSTSSYSILEFYLEVNQGRYSLGIQYKTIQVRILL